MNPESLEKEAEALAERLTTFRPAPAPSALRERLLEQRAKQIKIVTFRYWEMACMAALAASVVFGALMLFQQPIPEIATTKQQPASPASPQRLLSVREIGLLRRGTEPPVQLLAVEDVTIATASANSSAEPKVSISTRIIPVVLDYY